MRGLLRLLAPLTLLAMALGCGDSLQTTGGVPRQTEPPKVVSLSPGTTEIALSSGSADLVKGRTAACNFPEFMVNKVPVVASLKPDYEKLQTIGPTLILIDGDLFGDQEKEKLKGLGAKLFEFKATTVEGLVKEIYELSTLMAGETQFAQYCDRIVLERNRAMGDKPQEAIKVAMVSPGSGSEHLVAGTDSFQADVIRICGGTPVGPKSGKFEMANSEMLASEDPDVLLIPADKKNPQKAADALLADPRLSTLKAVKNRRIKFLDADIALRKGGRVDKLIQAVYRAIRVQD